MGLIGLGTFLLSSPVVVASAVTGTPAAAAAPAVAITAGAPATAAVTAAAPTVAATTAAIEGGALAIEGIAVAASSTSIAVPVAAVGTSTVSLAVPAAVAIPHSVLVAGAGVIACGAGININLSARRAEDQINAFLAQLNPTNGLALKDYLEILNVATTAAIENLDNLCATMRKFHEKAFRTPEALAVAQQTASVSIDGLQLPVDRVCEWRFGLSSHLADSPEVIAVRELTQV